MTDKRISYQELENTNIGRLSAKVANNRNQTKTNKHINLCLTSVRYQSAKKKSNAQYTFSEIIYPGDRSVISFCAAIPIVLYHYR